MVVAFNRVGKKEHLERVERKAGPVVVGIYIRVSTDEQAEQGYSLDAQRERLEAYCISQGWQEFRIYMDDGYTGTNTNRPGLKRLIRHIEEQKINLVLVYKLDRLSRKQKDVLSLLEDVFEKNNVGFKSATEPFDTSTPFGKAMIGVLAVFAQLDRDMIIERLTTGRKQRISNGKWPGGRVPFGYNWDSATDMFFVNEEEARIVKEIFKMYLEGHSRLAISEWASKRTNARYIDHSTVREILARPVYKGVLRQSEQEVLGNFKPIVEEVVWDAVQEECQKRKDGAPPIGEYMLTGLMSCGVCGSSVVHVKRKTVKRGNTYSYDFYACKQQHVRAKDKKNNCSLGYVQRNIVEEFVVKSIKELSADTEKLKKLLNDENDSSNQEAALSQLRNELKQVNVGLENLYDAIQSGDLKASSVSNRIRQLEEQREALEMDIDEFIDLQPRESHSKKESFEALKLAGDVWDLFTEEEQKIMLHKLVKKVILKGKGIDPEIEWFFTH